ncbi:MAG TPA: PfkB family carbohydrate kinase [Solirubrobacteraceae bacterium]
MSPPRVRSGGPSRVLCLGDALVDLIAERWVQEVAQARAFVPHFGGAVANVAVAAAAEGAPVALAGGAGADTWGHWLRERLVREGVDVSLFELFPDAQTQLALVTVDSGGEPHYDIYGQAGQAVVRVLGERVQEEVERAAAVVIGSNTLVGPDERELTMRVRETALELERPLVFDANLHLHRWRTRAEAAACANACVPRALLVRATAAEAAVMTGEDDPEAAASALVKAGARLVVLTLGRSGAMLRGELRADAPGVPARILSTIGAGGVLTGVLIARLVESRFYPPSVAAALAASVTAAARACERWGSLD